MEKWEYSIGIVDIYNNTVSWHGRNFKSETLRMLNAAGKLG